ncbi:hypothetical protein [Flavobacterium sp.]|uniref:hypothetical protein n=1 Tax=Flavobacterium sp. TaxID=239 RepID=UPI0037512B54
MTHHEQSLLKESLRVKYITLTEFEERYLFWKEHNHNMRYIDSHKYSNELNNAIQTQREYDIEQRKIQREREESGAIMGDAKFSLNVSRIMQLIEHENMENGIIAPEPLTNEEKAFEAEENIKNYLEDRRKTKPINNYEIKQLLEIHYSTPIYDYETYKQKFYEEISLKADKNEFANAKLNETNELLESIGKESKAIFFQLSTGTYKNVYDFFKELTNTNNDYLPDYAFIYECNKCNKNVDNLYYWASYLIPLNQFKRFLEFHINKQENGENEQSKNLVNVSNELASPPYTQLFLNKTNDLAIYVYFLGKLGISAKISLSKHEKSKVEYEKHISFFNEKYFFNLQKGFKLESLIAQINLIGDFIEGRNNPSSRNKIIERIKRVQKQLIQDYPDKSDNINELLSPFL